MGTETGLLLPSLQQVQALLVKLNNPLMGTETNIECFFYRCNPRVKLNNPLMGTETKIVATFNNL